MKKIPALAMVLSALGVIMTGCGSKSEDAAAPATTGTTAAKTTA